MSTKTIPSVPEVEREERGGVSLDYLPLYKVIMWNDNVTTMEFVVRMLIKVFGKDYAMAEKLMYEIHYTGCAVVAAFPLEVAEFKVQQVHNAASMEEFPLTCTIEPE
jgi:ATP-dependent Clp protease adaptor protein ClpS